MVPITRDVAIYHQGTFYHVHFKNSDGTAVRCRANGVCKTWKTRPNDYRLPVKYGLRDCFYITPANCVDWEITEEDWLEVRRKMLCVRLKVHWNIPNPILYDLALESGVSEETLAEICIPVDNRGMKQ